MDDNDQLMETASAIALSVIMNPAGAREMIFFMLRETYEEGIKKGKVEQSEVGEIK